MNPPARDHFADRVPEHQVAAILSCIATPPGRRQQPLHGDPKGDFDFWFDGGACKYHTGSAHYEFADGTVAMVACPATRLWLRIAFPGGTTVVIQQQ